MSSKKSMMVVRKMREMRDLDVEWIGAIPEGWKVIKLKNIASIVRGGSPRPIDEYLTDENSGCSWIKIGDTQKGSKYIESTKQKIIAEGARKSRMVHKGDLLLTNSMSFGEPYILNVDGCIHDGWVSFTDYKGIEKEFLYYILSSPLCLIQFQRQVDGGVVQNLNIDKIGATVVFVPTIEKQKRIITYLDVKCAKIDALIAKQQEIIEKLKAYKLSVITEAVTKGLNPNVPMKDSGVEWIGEIPIHWFIHKFCWDYSAMLGKMLDAKRISGENLHPYIKNVNVQWFHIDYDNLDQMDFEENEMERYSVQAGDLMICEGGEIGKCAIVPDDFPQGIFYQKALHRVRRRTENSGNIEFLSYLMFCMAKNECFDTSPEKATIAHLPGEALSQLRLPAPPIDEQQDIVGYLNQKCQQIEKSISTKQKIIDKLTEYKKSLIYEVVTGKREV